MDNIHILIVDDDFLTREMIKGLLELIGYEVIGEAMDGLQAIEMAQRLRPDVVLMDMDMPRMNGEQATRKIRDLWAIPVVIVTAYSCSEIAERVRNAGAVACINKPPLAHELRRAITEAVRPGYHSVERKHSSVFNCTC